MWKFSPTFITAHDDIQWQPYARALREDRRRDPGGPPGAFQKHTVQTGLHRKIRPIKIVA